MGIQSKITLTCDKCGKIIFAGTTVPDAGKYFYAWGIESYDDAAGDTDYYNEYEAHICDECVIKLFRKAINGKKIEDTDEFKWVNPPKRLGIGGRPIEEE
jgi:hypothetical protein